MKAWARRIDGAFIDQQHAHLSIAVLLDNEDLVMGIDEIDHVIAEDARDQDDMVDRACQIAFREGFAKAGQRVIIVAGVPLGTPGATNMVRIAFVGSDAAGD